MYILISYDIVSDKKRRKVDKLLCEYGFRVNYSVFELEVDKSSYEKLLFELPKLMDKRDSIRVYRFDKSTIQKSLELNPKLPSPFSKEEAYVL